jgi:DNA-directed RNA polymerase specialized sigma24 family protein
MAGDFEEFCVSALPRLLRFGHLLTGDAASAEDLVQTALVRTALRWSRVEDPAKAMAYVKTTMVRHVTETPSVRFDVVQGRITTSR